MTYIFVQLHIVRGMVHLALRVRVILTLTAIGVIKLFTWPTPVLLKKKVSKSYL